MIFKIPLIGWISTKPLICAKCKQTIGHFVEWHNDGKPFHFDCEIDYIAEKEGWTEYRERYKSVKKRYDNN